MPWQFGEQCQLEHTRVAQGWYGENHAGAQLRYRWVHSHTRVTAHVGRHSTRVNVLDLGAGEMKELQSHCRRILLWWQLRQLLAGIGGAVSQPRNCHHKTLLGIPTRIHHPQFSELDQSLMWQYAVGHR